MKLLFTLLITLFIINHNCFSQEIKKYNLIGQIEKCCLNLEKNNCDKIIEFVKNIQNAHNELLKEFEDTIVFPMGGYEILDIELTFHNNLFLLLGVVTEGYYGGAHQENSDYHVLFDMLSGNQIDISSLILESEKSKLILEFNNVINKELKNVKKCLGEDWDNYSETDFKIKIDDIERIKFSGSDIYLDWNFLPYYARACEPYFYIDVEQAEKYFDNSLFE